MAEQAQRQVPGHHHGQGHDRERGQDRARRHGRRVPRHQAPQRQREHDPRRGPGAVQHDAPGGAVNRPEPQRREGEAERNGRGWASQREPEDRRRVHDVERQRVGAGQVPVHPGRHQSTRAHHDQQQSRGIGRDERGRQRQRQGRQHAQAEQPARPLHQTIRPTRSGPHPDRPLGTDRETCPDCVHNTFRTGRTFDRERGLDPTSRLPQGLVTSDPAVNSPAE